MKLRNIFNKINSKVKSPVKLIIAKNSWEVCKLVHRDYNFWSVQEIYNYYKNFEGDNKDTAWNIREKVNYKLSNDGEVVHAVAFIPKPLIVLNAKSMNKQSKQYIKFVILHEIGHYFRGHSETEADNFAEEWMKKI